MDGNFYVDSRQPFISTDIPSVTLAATNKALVPIANLPLLPGNYFGFVGKLVRMRIFGRLTTGATPGNGQFTMYYGSGADATGVVVASSAVFALTASQASMSILFEMFVRCRTIGGTGLGTLFGTGIISANPAVLASSLQPVMIPAATPAPSATMDLSAAGVLSPQFLRSGSTAEALQIHDFSFEALN